MRATNNKHLGNVTTDAKVQNKVSKKSRKGLKALSASAAAAVCALALIVPTTTLAPGVDAYSDSRSASYSVGDIDKFSAVITNNCVEVTTAPVTEPVKEAKKTEAKKTAKSDAAKTEDKTKAKTAEKSESSATEETTTDSDSTTGSDYDYSDSGMTTASYTGGALVTGAAIDPSYTPTHVSLSAYDRAKTERLVMGEGGVMGYEGCALIAQSIRDAMVRSGTSSIDQIISEYQYFGSTAYEPNQDVKDAVSFIFDQDGVAIQHRVMCFYVGTSAWHETQTFLYQIGGVRFFDLTSA